MVINLQRSDSDVQSADINSSINSLYTWSNLIREGRYQFRVVAFTTEGPGPAETLTYNTQHSKLIILALSSHLVSLHHNHSIIKYDSTYIFIHNKI